MGENKKADLSKIDFSRLTLPEWYGHAVKASIGPLGVELHRGKYHRFAYLRFGGSAWEYVGTYRWNELEAAKTYTDRVDAFIAEESARLMARDLSMFIHTESARLAAEDEAANWVSVPWQDVEWLSDSGSIVLVDFGTGELKDWNHILEDGSRLYRKDALHHNTICYFSDRRTLPAGYDPTKPRWVEVDWRDVTRLESSGATIAYILKDGTHLPREYVETVGVKPRDRQRYAVDVHTLKPGVPLHVDPPKPEPRPCTREFALAYPGESEWRVQQHEGHRFSWSTWQLMSRAPLSQASIVGYEFRTAARESEKPDVSWFHDARQYTEPPTVLSDGVWKIVATRIA